MKGFKQTWRQAGMPCRIGTTSYIIPADILPNLEFLKDIVEDVELVLFESDEFSNLPSKADVREMGRIAEGAGLSFTVHLPLDAFPGAADENQRKKSAEKWLRVMDLTEPISPFGWVVHLNDPPIMLPPGGSAGISFDMGDHTVETESGQGPSWAHWLGQCGKTLDALISRTEPRLLCVETLSYDFNRVLPLVMEKNCAICIDIGHLVLTGRDIAACLDAWLARARIIHLHGVNSEGRDHVHVGHLDAGLLEGIINALKADGSVQRVLTLEIFSRDDLERSFSVLKAAI